MGVSDGTVLGLKKLIDHGPPSARWNMVIVSEGYQASELPKFHQDAQKFVEKLFHTRPFDEMWCAVNVYRLDVTSTESGADDPGGACGGSGAVRATYFDAKFCSDGSTHRLLDVNRGLVVNTVQGVVPDYDIIQVIVNTTVYGGSGAPPGGAPVGVFSLGTSPVSGKGGEEIGIHEMGHSAFGLADEYPYADGNHHPAIEPFEPNITVNSNKTTIKWKALIAAATVVPTTQNADCTQEDSQVSPVPAGTVGAFEGAHYYHCGAFRPEFNCEMRELGNPFCAVCLKRIRDTLQPFVAPVTATLVTPSVNFLNIPEGIGGTGVTTYRAVRFEIGSCAPLTLQVIAGPTGGFALPLGPVDTVNPGQLTSEGRIWISYTSSIAGSSSSGTVTIQAAETGQSWLVPITANTVARPRSAVALVLDHSGSMGEDAGDGSTKVKKLRDAAGVFIDAMLQGDGIGVVRFDDTAQELMQVTDVGVAMSGAGRTQARMIIEGPQLDPAGNTSIGDGLLKGTHVIQMAQASAVPPYAVTAMVVLTDGMENTGPSIASASGSITANTFAVGLGKPGNINVDALTTLTGNHEGYLLVTGAFTTGQQFRLQKYFVQILAGISNADVVVDPAGFLPPEAVHRIPFTVTEADYGLDVILLSDGPRLIDFRLETPDGMVIDPSLAAAEPNVERVTTDAVAYYRIGLPALPVDPAGSHAGTWTAVLSLADTAPRSRTGFAAGHAQTRGVAYDVVVHCYSSLRLHARVAQASFAQGAEIRLAATLTEYSVPVAARARVWAEVTRPDGSTATLVAAEEEAGRFAGAMTATDPGVYTVRVRAAGATFAERPFTREQTLTATVLAGADTDPCARLVDCRGEKPQPAPGRRRRLKTALLVALVVGLLLILIGILLVLPDPRVVGAALVVTGALLLAGAVVAIAVIDARS